MLFTLSSSFSVSMMWVTLRFVPFLIPYYQQIVMIDPRYYYDDVEQLMTQRGVTDVLFLYNLSTFSADTALADTLGAAS